MALQTEPLALPSGNLPQMGPLDLMLMAAGKAINYSSPEIAVGAAHTAQTTTDATNNAQAMAGYSLVANGARNMYKQTGVMQQQLWDQMPTEEQSKLSAVGYSPPSTRGGVLNDVGRWAGDVVHNPVANDIFNALGSGVRMTQHAFRTLEVAGGGLGAPLNPLTFATADWARAWNETSTGASYIDPKFKSYVQEHYSPTVYQAAYSLATGASIQELGQSAPQGQGAALVNFLQSAPVQAATGYLNAGHISLGRVVADVLMGPSSYSGAGMRSLTEKNSFYRFLSGSIDGLGDAFGDPYIVGGKAMAGFRGVQMLADEAADIPKMYHAMPGVKAWVDQAASLSKSIKESESAQGVGRLLEMGKSLGNSGVLEGLVKAGATTPKEVMDYLGSAVGWAQLAKRESLVAGRGVIVPHLTYVGQLSMKAKGGLDKVLNYLGEDSITVNVDPNDIQATSLAPLGRVNKIKVGGGRMISRAYRIMPTGRSFDLAGNDILPLFRDWLSGFMKPANVDTFVTRLATAPSIGAKQDVAESALKTVARLAGHVPGTDSYNALLDPWMAGRFRKFGPGGTDLVTGSDGRPVADGLGKLDMNHTIALPSFPEVYVASKKLGITQALTRGVNAGKIGTFMGVWRALTLARVGFGTKVPLEEAVNFMLRNGPVAYIRSQALTRTSTLAGRAVEKASALAGAGAFGEPEMVGADEIARAAHGLLYDNLGLGLDESEKAGASSLADLWARRLGRMVSHAMDKTATKLSGQDYTRYMTDLIARDGLDHDSPLFQLMAAHHDYDPVDPSASREVSQLADQEGKLLSFEFDRGKYKGYTPTEGDNIFRVVYMRQLSRMARDPWYREALRVSRPTGERVQATAEKLMADPDWLALARRAWKDREGRQVADGTITHEQAALDHATALVAATDRTLRSPAGDWLKVDAGPAGSLTEEKLADYLVREGQSPPWFTTQAMRDAGKPGQLASLALEDLPRDIQGPELLPSLGGMDPRKITNKIFKAVITPQIDALSRHPIRLHNYAASRLAMEPTMRDYIAHGMAPDEAARIVHEISVDRSVNTTINFVHNPELRSQLSMVTRNLSPFWFAKEQFYKRWARTFVYSPWAFRQAELIHQGLGNVGFIHTDPSTGQQYFVYPASALVTNAIAHALHAAGVDAMVPAQGDLVGNPTMLNAGLSGGLLPDFGPLMTVPLIGLKNVFPETTRAIDAIQGQNAASANWLSALLPADVTRLLQAADPAMLNPGQWYSTQMLVIQYLEATGHGMGFPGETQVGTLAAGQQPPTNTKAYRAGDFFAQAGGTDFVLQPGGQWADNSADAQARWLQRVQHYTRILMGVKAMYGFLAPASPTFHFNPKGMSDELLGLINTEGYEQGVATFMQRNPDATAMTVFQTQDKTGGFLPSTPAAMGFMQSNSALFTKHKLASTFFIPAPDTKGPYDLAAYQQQLRDGLRQQKTPEQYINDITYQESAQFYYGVLNYKDQQVASGAITPAQGNAVWTQFSQNFMAANPLFAASYTPSGELKREQIMIDVGNAITDHSAPPGPQTEALYQLYQAWLLWRGQTTNHGQAFLPNASEVTALNQQFAQAVSAFEQKNPGVQPLVQRVIAPELESTLTDMAAQGINISL